MFCGTTYYINPLTYNTGTMYAFTRDTDDPDARINESAQTLLVEYSN